MVFSLKKSFLILSLAVAALVLVFGASAGAQQQDQVEEIIIKLERVKPAKAGTAEITTEAPDEAPVLRFKPVKFKPVKKEEVKPEIADRTVELEIVFTETINGVESEIEIQKGVVINITAPPGLRLEQQRIVTTEATESISVRGQILEGVSAGTLLTVSGEATWPDGRIIKTETSFEVAEGLLPPTEPAVEERPEEKPAEEVREIVIDLQAIPAVEPEWNFISPESGMITISLSEKLEKLEALTLKEIPSGKFVPLRYNSRTGLFEATNLSGRLYQLQRPPKGEAFLEKGFALEPPPSFMGGGGGAAYQDGTQSNQIDPDNNVIGGVLVALDLEAQQALEAGGVIVTLQNEQGNLVQAQVDPNGEVNFEGLGSGTYTVKAITDSEGRNLTMLIKVTQGKPPSFGGVAPMGLLPSILLLAGAGLMVFSLLLRNWLARGVWLTMLAAGLGAGLVGLVQSNFLGLFRQPIYPMLPPPPQSACVCNFRVVHYGTRFIDGRFGNSVELEPERMGEPRTVHVAQCVGESQRRCEQLDSTCDNFCTAFSEQKIAELQQALTGILDTPLVESGTEKVDDLDNSWGSDESQSLNIKVTAWERLHTRRGEEEQAVNPGVAVGGEGLGPFWACDEGCDSRSVVREIPGVDPDDVIWGPGFGETTLPLVDGGPPTVAGNAYYIDPSEEGLYYEPELSEE